MTYTATIDRVIPGFTITVRAAEGFIEFHYGTGFDRSVTSVYDTGSLGVSEGQNVQIIDKLNAIIGGQIMARMTAYWRGSPSWNWTRRARNPLAGLSCRCWGARPRC